MDVTPEMEFMKLDSMTSFIRQDSQLLIDLWRRSSAKSVSDFVGL